MRTNGEHKRSIKSLLRHWQAMAKILIGFGARLSRQQRANTAQAYAMAEEVELAARAALVKIRQDLSGRGPSEFVEAPVFAWLGLSEHAPHWRAPAFAPPILDPG